MLINRLDLNDLLTFFKRLFSANGYDNMGLFIVIRHVVFIQFLIASRTAFFAGKFCARLKSRQTESNNNVIEEVGDILVEQV